MKNSLRIHKWTHNEFNIFILGVLTHPLFQWIVQIKTIKYIMVHNGIFPSLRDKNAQIHPSLRDFSYICHDFT